MAIVKGLKSNTIWKAFFMNSLVNSIIIVFAIIIKDYSSNTFYLDPFYKKNDEENNQDIKLTVDIKSIFITFFSTFIMIYGLYLTMYFLFGYGEELLV